MMSIEVKLTFSTFEEAAAALVRLAGPDADIPASALQVADDGQGGSVAVVTVPVNQEADKPKRTRRTKAEMEAEKAQSAEASVQVQQPAAAEEPAGEADEPEADAAMGTPDPAEMTSDEAEAMFKNKVRPALGAVIAKVGQDEARAHLKAFGFEKLSDIPPARYAAFIASCEKRVG